MQTVCTCVPTVHAKSSYRTFLHPGFQSVFQSHPHSLIKLTAIAACPVHRAVLTPTTMHPSRGQREVSHPNSVLTPRDALIRRRRALFISVIDRRADKSSDGYAGEHTSFIDRRPPNHRSMADAASHLIAARSGSSRLRPTGTMSRTQQRHPARV